MKRCFSTLLPFYLVFVLTGCQGDTDNRESKPETPAPRTKSTPDTSGVRLESNGKSEILTASKSVVRVILHADDKGELAEIEMVTPGGRSELGKEIGKITSALTSP